MSAESAPIDLILENQNLVKAIAQSIFKRMPSIVQLDDLIQWGNFGLMDAVRKFDSSRPNKFKTYAVFRIRGAMLDGLRDQDITTRSTRDVEKKLRSARDEFYATSGGHPTPKELADQLRVTVDELREMELRITPLKLIPLEGFDLFTAEDRKALLISAQNQTNDLESKILAMQKLKKIVDGQPPIDRACFMLYYIWGFTMIEISDLFSCTESRISQRIARVHLDGRR